MPVRGPGFTRNARGCIAALVFTALAFDSPCAVGAEGSDIAPRRGSPEGTLVDPHAIVLLVANVARLRDGELETAQALAATILRTAGLEPAWADSGAPSSAGMQVYVVLGSADRSERMIARLGAAADLLGMAPAGSRRVYIFAERIRRYAASKKRSFEEVLGHVLAHEVGHHLLPGQEHADTGIMQADIGQAFSTPWFTGRQARSIHTSLLNAQLLLLQASADTHRASGR